MKIIPLLSALIIAVTPAFAADIKPPAKKTEPAKKKPDAKMPDPKKPGPKKPAPQRTDMIEEEIVALLTPYDKNTDFEIDVEEFKAIEADFKKTQKGPLKQFDKAKDGAIDAMIDRAGINVKLGSAAPKKPKSPAPAPVKKPDAAPAPPPPPKKPDAPKSTETPEGEKKPG